MKVVDVRRELEGIYIGRVFGNLEGSVLGNPYKIGRDGNRDEVIEKYRRWLWTEFKKGGEVFDELERIKELVENGQDVNLRCWCQGKRCHGDVIKNCIEWMIKN